MAKHKKLILEFKVSNIKNAPSKEDVLKARHYLVGYTRNETELLGEALQLLQAIYEMKEDKRTLTFIALPPI